MSWYQMMQGASLSVPAGPTYTYTDPSTISGLQFLLDAHSTAGMTLTGTGGDELSQYIERSGNGYTGTQVTGTKRPRRITNVIDGQAVLRFDGTDDFLSFGDVLDVRAGGLQIITVARRNSDFGTLISKSVFAGTENRWAYIIDSGNQFFLAHVNGTVRSVATPMGLGSFEMIHATLHRDAPANHGYVQIGKNGDFDFNAGALMSSELSVDMDTTYRLLLGAYANSNDTGEQSPYLFNGDIAYMAIYNRRFTPEERKGVCNHLKQRFPSLSYSFVAD